MPIDPFERKAANCVAAESGYSAPYLYLLEDEQPSSSLREATTYTRRKVRSVAQAIHAGYGQGSGDAYKPWIRIRRNFSSPVSHQVFDSVGIHARNHHFLSTLEFHTALVCGYLGAVELRECLPLWPFSHPHPDSARNARTLREAPQVRGLLELADKAGIDHGCFVGTTVPYIASIDLMLWFRFGGKLHLTGISCKPREIADQSARAKQRIELDRIYCSTIGAHHVHEDGSVFDQELLKQLLWLRPLVSEIRTHRGSARLDDFAASFDEFATERCVSESAVAAGQKIGLARDAAFKFLRLSVWLHLIDVDLSQRLQMKRPIKRGSDRILKALKARYWGDQHV